MKYSITCLNPTFTFVVGGRWVKTDRGVEWNKFGEMVFTDINEAYQRVASYGPQKEDVVYLVEECP